MRIPRVYTLIAFIALLSSCSEPGSNLLNDQYSSVTIEDKVHQIDNEGEGGIIWPVFSSPNEKLANLLNAKLSMKEILGQSYEEIDEEIQLSVKDYGMPQGTVEASYSVNMNDGFILDIDFSQVSLGAHHYYSSFQKRINLKTGEEIKIQDIINQENFSQIVNKCNKQIKKEAEDIILEAKANDGEDLSSYYGDIEFTEANLNNYTITPNSLVFVYDIDLPHVIRYYEQDFAFRFDFNEYAYMVKKGSLLDDYLTNNDRPISKVSEDVNSQTEDEDDNSKYKRVNTLDEFLDAVNNVAGGTEIFIESDLVTDKVIEISRSNISITGDRSKNTMIYTPDPDAFVLMLINCDNVNIRNLKMRHITGNISCGSGVVELSNCKNISIDNCDISGCGAYGITAHSDCENISITNNRIYDCSYWGIEMHGTNCKISGNTFYRNGDGTHDYYSDDESGESLIVENNKFKSWDIKNLVDEVNEYMAGNGPVVKEFENNMGQGSVIASYRHDEMIYLEVEWHEIDDFKMVVYFGRRLPQNIEWTIEYGETDAPDGDYEMEPDIYNYTALYEGWELISIYESFADGTAEEISDSKRFLELDDQLIKYIDNWKKLLREDLDIEDVFEDMPML